LSLLRGLGPAEEATGGISERAVISWCKQERDPGGIRERRARSLTVKRLRGGKKGTLGQRGGNCYDRSCVT